MRLKICCRDLASVQRAVVFLFMLGGVLHGYALVQSGSGFISGLVTDEHGQPLSEVKIRLYHLQSKAQIAIRTNDRGEWSAAIMGRGSWYLDFEKTGYETRRICIQVVGQQARPAWLETRLKRLEGLVITEEIIQALEEANALFSQGKLDEAGVIYQNILTESPDSYVINYYLGNYYLEKEKYDQAIDCYQKVIDKNPQFVPGLIALGNCYLKKKEIARAIDCYQRLDINKIEDPQLLYQIGIVYFNRGLFLPALTYFQKAVTLQPDFPDARYQLGLTCLLLGRYTQARLAFQNYLKYDSESDRSVQVKNFLEFLRTRT